MSSPKPLYRKNPVEKIRHIRYNKNKNEKIHKERREKMKKALKKHLLAIIACVFAICMMPAPAKAEETQDMGIIRMNLAGNNTMWFSGKKMNAALNTLNTMAEKGLITRSESKQSFDLNNDNNIDIGFSALFMDGKQSLSFHRKDTCDITGTWSYEVPDDIKAKALENGYPCCSQFYINFSDAENVLLETGMSEGGSITFSDDPYHPVESVMNRTIAKGQTITMTATPKEGYVFKGWYDGVVPAKVHFVTDHTGELLSADSEYTLTAYQNESIYALFEKAGKEPEKTEDATVTPAGTQPKPTAPSKTQTVKKANPIKVKAKTVKVSAKKVAKKKQIIAKKKIMKITGAQGQVKFKIKKVSKAKYKKYFRINEKGGQIAIKKGLKKGTYKLKIKVTAAGNAKYKAGSKMITVKVKVR